MSLIQDMRRQVAVFWSRGSPDPYGRYSFAGPVEIKCRWEDKPEEFMSATGERRVSSAVVYVDRDMKPGDMLKKGPMESGTPDDPNSLDDALQIQAFANMPDFDAVEFLKTAYL